MERHENIMMSIEDVLSGDIVGISGHTGSGKSTLAKYLGAKGQCEAIHIDIIFADEICAAKKDAIAIFGNQVFNSDGTVNTRCICMQHDKWAYLMEFIAPVVDQKVNQIIDLNLTRGKNVILDWSFLSKMDFVKRCTLKILVQANAWERYKKLEIRDELGCEIDEAISRTEFELDYLNGFTHDFCVKNSYDDDFFKNAQKLILQRCEARRITLTNMQNQVCGITKQSSSRKLCAFSSSHLKKPNSAPITSSRLTYI